MEVWKDINGYEGLYQISNYGNVRSLDRYVNGNNGSKTLKKGVVLKNKLPIKGIMMLVYIRMVKLNIY